jgi:hypothetical protein
MNNKYNFFDLIYHLLSLFIFYPIFHDAILCKGLISGMRGEYTNSCSFGLMYLYVFLWAIVWFILSFFATKKGRKIKQEYGANWLSRSLTWPWKIIFLMYFLAFISGL